MLGPIAMVVVLIIMLAYLKVGFFVGAVTTGIMTMMLLAYYFGGMYLFIAVSAVIGVVVVKSLSRA